MNSLISTLQILSKGNPKFSKSVASLCVSNLFEKLTDIKLNKNTAAALTAIAERTSLQFVVAEGLTVFPGAKNPKIIEVGMKWIAGAIEEFGVAGISVKKLVEGIKNFGLTSANVAARKESISVLASLRLFLGPDVRTLVQDLNAQLLSMVDAEFEKVAAKGPIVVTRVQQVETEVETEELVQKTDISAKITSQLIEDLANVQWKVRSEALDQILAILEAANHKIKNTLGELPGALKARLSDTNKNLVIKVLETCGILATSTGKSFDKHSRLLVSPIAACLSDQKPQVRSAAINALDKIYEAVGLDPMIPSLSQSLTPDQPLTRKDLTKWFSEKLQALQSPTADFSPLVHPTLLCLQDKSAEVRKNAQSYISHIINGVGFDTVREKCTDIFNASALQTVLPIIDAFRTTTAVVTNTPTTPVKKSTVQSKNKSAVPTRATTKNKAPAAAPQELPPPMSTTTSDFVICTQDMRQKEQRADKDRGMTKWTVEAGSAPRKDLVDFLSEQCEGNFSSEVHKLMFSSEHFKEKDFMTALNLLDEGLKIPQYRIRYMSNTDLILKYFTVRLADTNTSILIKILEMLESLCTLLDEEGFQLSEYEAAAFLPSFIAKVGDPKETIRTKIRSILKQFCRIYPASKLFLYLLQGLESKNARTRIECLTELAALVQRNGLQVCNPSKALPVVAGQISDRDAGVRNAAISVITQAYLLVGDGVYKLVGRINEKDKSLLEEKLKRLPPIPLNSVLRRTSDDVNNDNVPSRIPSSPVTTRRAAQGSPPMMAAIPTIIVPPANTQTTFSLDLDKLNLPKYSNASALARTNTLRTVVYSASDQSNELSASKTVSFNNEVQVRRMSENDPNLQPKHAPPAPRERDLMMDITITQLTSGDAYTSINALKQLERTLSSTPETLLPHLNEIVSAITLQIRIAYTSADLSVAGVFRLCKHLVNVLVQIFTDVKLARALGKNQLHQCCQELLNRLLDPSLQAFENGSQLSRALNVLMVRILENCIRNDSFSVLLEILEQSAHATVEVTPEQLPIQTRFTELVMKCIWKITKIIPSLLESKELRVNQLLLDVHKFLMSSPPNGWKRRAAEKSIPQADLPLRTVKTILHELVNCLDNKVFEHLDLIPDANSSQVLTYLKQMLDSDKRKVGSTPPPSTTPRSKSPPINTSAAPQNQQIVTSTTNENPNQRQISADPQKSGRLSPQEIETCLQVIFEKIGNKELTKQGIQELHEFQQNHPYTDADIERHLSKTGSYFQGYIKRGLSALMADGSTEGRGTGMVGIPGMRSSHIITGSTAKLVEAGLRRPNTVSSFSNVGQQDGTALLYRDRLENLQKMFSKSDDVNAGETRNLNVPEQPSQIVIPGNIEGNGRSDVSLIPGNIPGNRASTQTVAELKERLAKMKLTMGAS
ncbi:Microtubule-associated protein, microtubule dynamics during spindle orientation [Nowakowskiella sp. JEL0078]|nr:Microtubule-associated protein, microtubule dynamics during spindle orientation [Nowakowskiella sp. JEL0078]